VVAASGPSAVDVDLEIVKSKAKLIVINESWRLAPWADVLYSADHAWWAHRGSDQRTACEPWGVEAIDVRRIDAMVFDEEGVVGRGGGASGFQAVNLAVNWGARRIVLVGFDMRPGARHWHADHGGKLNNPTDHLLGKWARVLDGAAKALRDRGVDVVNTSFGSALTAYPKMSLKDALCWR
jgi:hypothetical protein